MEQQLSHPHTGRQGLGWVCGKRSHRAEASLPKAGVRVRPGSQTVPPALALTRASHTVLRALPEDSPSAHRHAHPQPRRSLAKV